MVVFQLFAQKPPMDEFPPNFCITVEVVDIITCDKFFSNRLRDVDYVGVKNEGFPLTKPMAANTGLPTAPPVIVL